MQHDLWELATFEKLTTVSRENSVYEVLCYLDLEIQPDKTVINVLLKNEKTGEYIKDSIAPEYMKFCSVGTFFRGGKRLLNHKALGVVRDIEIDVPATGSFRSYSSVLAGTDYEKSFLQKLGSHHHDYSKQCLAQKCMCFTQGPITIVIPCAVIAATYYLTSHSMRVQLFAQHLKGLYEDVHYIEFSKTALIILHRNARTYDAKRIARFALYEHAGKCWDNVMNVAREHANLHDRKHYYPLVAKIPVIQNGLNMKVRGQELPNSEGGITLLVHEILREHTSVPFYKLFCGRRGNAKPAQDAIVLTEKDAKPNGIITNKPPSKVYKGHWVQQFGVPSNPLWEQVVFEEIELPPLSEYSNLTTQTEQVEESVELSPQTAKGNDPNQKVAKAELQPEAPKVNHVQRMALAEFREMVAGFVDIEGVLCFEVSSDMKIPLKGDWTRSRYTLRESYGGNPAKRRNYTYATFKYNGKFVCLVEIDQTEISTHVGTFVMAAAYTIGEAEAEQAAKDFAQAVSIGAMETQWSRQGISFTTKSHPPKQARELWNSWREKVLEIIISCE